MAMTAEMAEKIKTQPELLDSINYLDAVGKIAIYGHMGRRGQDIDILLTPENVALFEINHEATALDLIEKKPPAAHMSTSFVVDRLESIRDMQACPGMPKRALAFLIEGGKFIDKLILKGIDEPVEHNTPHQKHTAFLEPIHQRGVEGGQILIPAGKIQVFNFAYPPQQIEPATSQKP